METAEWDKCLNQEPGKAAFIQQPPSPTSPVQPAPTAPPVRQDVLAIGIETPATVVLVGIVDLLTMLCKTEHTLVMKRRFKRMCSSILHTASRDLWRERRWFGTLMERLALGTPMGAVLAQDAGLNRTIHLLVRSMTEDRPLSLLLFWLPLLKSTWPLMTSLF